jgi:hypothetical protein
MRFEAAAEHQTWGENVGESPVSAATPVNIFRFDSSSYSHIQRLPRLTNARLAVAK